jgi:Tol biopolymer transport system component
VLSVVLRYSLTNGVTKIINSNAVNIEPGSELNRRSLSITPDGNLVAFESTPNYYNNNGTYVDVWNALSNVTIVVSAATNQTTNPNSVSDWPTLTPNGQFVAFASRSPYLTSPYLGGWHLYVYNLQAGTTQLVDADTNGVGSSTNLMTFPRISDNGSAVAFECLDGSLVPNDNNRACDVFVRNLTAGSNELISAAAPSLPAATPNGSSLLGSSCVSSNGGFVAFSSGADNLAPGDTNGMRDVFVFSLAGGTNILASLSTNGINSGNGLSGEPALSASGRYVAFSSTASNLVANDNNNAQDVFVRDLQNATNILVSANSGGRNPGDGSSFTPSISVDGRYVLFYSTASNLVSGPVGNPGENVFWRDTLKGVTRALTSNAGSSATNPTTAALSPSGLYAVASEVLPGHTTSTLYEWSAAVTNYVYTNSTSTVVSKVGISPDGNRIIYYGSSKIYVIDIAAKTQVLLGNTPTNSRASQFSADSQYLAYVAADSFKTNQIYLYSFLTLGNAMISQSYLGAGGGNANSDAPNISPDDRYVAYQSLASNLVPGDTNVVESVYFYDSLTGTNTLVSVSQSGNQPGNNSSHRQQNLWVDSSGSGRRPNV